MDDLKSGTATNEHLAAELHWVRGDVHQLMDRVAVIETALQRVRDELSVIDPME